MMPAVFRPKKSTDLVRLGTDYGGWWVPNTALTPGAIAYCGGAGEDISFDSELVARGLAVRTFDPTPRAIAYVADHAPDGDFKFFPVGWWHSRTVLRFYVPANAAHVSHSVKNLQRTDDYLEAPVASVKQLMEEHGDPRVDLLKMDIEGAEYEVIESMLQDGPRPSTLCIEFDQPTPIWKTVRAIRTLTTEGGYHLQKIDQWNYTFTLR